MNSYSDGGRQRESRPWEDEISALIDLNLGNQILDPDNFAYFKELKFKPVNLENLKESNWLDRGPARRRAPRYHLRLTVLVCNPFKTFRTESLNVSVAGVLLKDLMPDEFSRQPFEVLLIAESSDGKKTYMLFRGRSVDAPLRSNRVIFDSLTPDSEAKLTSLIEDLTPLI